MSYDHESIQYHDAASEELVKRYPHGQVAILASLTLLVLAFLAVFLLFGDSLATAYGFFLPFCLAAAVVIIALRIPRLRRGSEDLLKNGVSNIATTSRRKSLLQSFLLLVTAALYVYVPLALAGSVPPVFWISPLMGVIAGTNLGELIHAAYVRIWERRHKGILFTSYLYEFDDRGKPQLRTITLRLRRESG